MINLDNQTPIASGLQRQIFLHPDDPQKIIKVFKPDYPVIAVSWWARMLRPNKTNANTRDLAEHAAARSSGGGVEKHVTRVHALESTSKGSGLVCDYVCNEDGSACLTLGLHVKEYGMDGIRDDIRRLFDLLAEKHILFRDANSQNLMVSRTSTGFILVIIEGLGESNFIPYASWSKNFNKIKLQRKKKRLLAGLEMLV